MRRAGTTIAITVALGTMALTACSGSPPSSQSTSTSTSSPTATQSTPPTSTPRPTSSSSRSSSPAEAAALKTYRSFWNALAKAERAGDPGEPSLRQYGADKALAEAQQGLLELQRLGIVFRGMPQLEPSVLGVRTVSGAPAVDIHDCVDSTDWKPVYASSGKSAAAPGQAVRVPQNVLVRQISGKWLVTNMAADRSRPC